MLLLCAWGATRTDADVAVSQTAYRQGKLLPVDVAKNDVGLRRLRRQLLGAAASRDVGRLLPLLGERVRGQIGDEFEVSRGEFPREFARYSAADQLMFWQDLRDAVSLGFARFTQQGEGMVCAPYVCGLLDSGFEEDGEPILVVTANGVNVRADPNASSPVIETLHYDLVHRGSDIRYRGPHVDSRATKSGEFGGTHEWRRFKTPKGRLGWILSKYVSDSGTVVFDFSKIGGDWKLTRFGPG